MGEHKSVEEFEAELESMERELSELQAGVDRRREQFIRARKILDILRKVREVQRTKEVRELEEMAGDVSL